MKKIKKMIPFILILMMFVSTSFGADIVPDGLSEAPKIVTGTKNLFEWVMIVLLFLIPVTAGVVIAYNAIRKYMTSDDIEIKRRNKLMKNVLIGAILAFSADGIIVAVLSFYK